MEPTNHDAQTQTDQRSIRDGHWCWQDKGVLQLITKTFADSETAATERSLYVALSEIASDEGSETFQVTKALIAYRAGLSVKTVERLLPGLEQLGVIKISRSLANVASGAIKAPNTYTLLSMRLSDATSMRLRGASSKSDKVKERERTLKKARSRVSRGGSASAPPARDGVDGFEKLSPDQQEIIDTYNATLPPLGWRRVTRITDALRDVLPSSTPEEWRWFFEDIAQAPPETWPKQRTFVRARWHNY